MAEGQKNEKNLVEHPESERKEVVQILKRCKGRSRQEVLTNASKLDSAERLKIIEYFNIDPKDFASTIILFWLNPTTRQGMMQTTGDIDEFGND